MHHYLQFAPAQCRLGSARTATRLALEQLGLPKGSRLDWNHGEITIPRLSHAPSRFKLGTLLSSAIRDGGPFELYRIIDLQAPRFGQCFELATNSEAIKLSVNLGDFSKEVAGPCRIAPIERELVDDIFFFREAACSTSAESDLYHCSRHYRSYLQSAVSLIDSFINRYVQTTPEDQRKSLPSVLLNPSRLDERIDAWITTFTQRQLQELRNGREWSQFMEIRRERNRAVHAIEPYFGVSLREMQPYLNACKSGIGGLLLQMRKFENLQTLGFIERLIHRGSVLNGTGLSQFSGELDDGKPAELR